MNPTRRMLLCATLALAGCGSSTITPPPGDASIARDAPAPGVDAAAPNDVPAPPSDRPSPATDTGPAPTLESLCAFVCGRRLDDCGLPAEPCQESCLRFRLEVNADRCMGVVADALRCAGENPFICLPRDAQPAEACLDAYQIVDRCLRERPPFPPLADAGRPDV